MGLNKALLIENRLCGGSGNRLGSAGDIADHTGLYEAGAEACAVLVAGAADDLGLCGKAEAMCNGRRQRADDGFCLYDLAEKLGVKTEDVCHLGRPCFLRNVVDHRSRCLSIVNRCNTGHPVDKVAVNVQEVFCFFKNVRSVLLYPQHLCGCVGRVEVKAGNLKHACRIDRLGYLGSLCLGAAVEPNDAVHKCIAVLIGRYDGVVYSIHADRSDLGRVNAGIGNELLYNGGERVEIILNGLLCPAGIGVYGIVRAGSLCDDLALGIDKQALERLRTEVNADYITHYFCSFFVK